MKPQTLNPQMWVCLKGVEVCEIAVVSRSGCQTSGSSMNAHTVLVKV